jgi:hypothetical protein
MLAHVAAGTMVVSRLLVTRMCAAGVAEVAVDAKG